MTLDLRFPAHYDAELLSNNSAFMPDTQRIHYSGVTDQAAAKPLTVYVRPWSSSDWIGTFNRYSPYDDVETGIFTCPNPDCICVLSGGQGYFVNVRDPSDWEAVSNAPITDVRDVPTRDLILLVESVNITAYDSAGLRWRTRRLSYDGIRISRISEERIEGFGWSAPDDEDVEFVVNLDDGTHTGGASPHAWQ